MKISICSFNNKLYLVNLLPYFSYLKEGLNIALIPVNMARLSFGSCKKKNCFWSLQNFLFSKIVSDPIFVMICISETNFFVGTCLKNKIFCRDQKQK